MLDAEMTFYTRSRKRFLKMYHEKYLLISQKRLCGVYDTHQQAYDGAIQTREVGSFIIKHCVK